MSNPTEFLDPLIEHMKAERRAAELPTAADTLPRMRALVSEAWDDSTRGNKSSRHNYLNGLKQMARPISLGNWGRLGVVAVVGLCAYLFGVKYSRDITLRSPAANVYTTTSGQRATVTLADGSHVTLAPATVLKVTGRIVELSGEAVFKVSQKENQPFTVKTNRSTIQVLGTTFDVREYSDDATTRVAVLDGKVALKAVTAVDSPVLSNGDVAVLAADGIQLQRRANVESVMSWTTGTLYFDKAPLSQVLPELARWYGVEFVAADESLLHRRLTATLSTDALTPTVLELITSSLDVRYARVGRIVTLYPGR